MKSTIWTKAIVSLSVIASTLLVCNNADGQTISTIAGTGVAGTSGDGGPATAAQFRNPLSGKFDASGNMYIVEYNSHRIRKIDASGVITTIAGAGGASFSGDGGAATAATFNNPIALAIDTSGNIYVSDRNNNRIRKISTSGVITTVAGTGTASYTGDGGAATAATINRPNGLNTDAAGNVYFADEDNNVIRKITVSTGIITTIAGTGATTFGGDLGPATAADLNKPKDVFVAASGEIYIADNDNNRIRRISSSGIITTIAGTGPAGFTGDGGSALTARLSHPLSIWISPSGEILLTDSWNNRIRKISTTGTITTIAGNGTYGYGGDGGPATSASFKNPTVTTDAAGYIYLTDEGNHRIRKLSLPPLTVTGSANLCEGNTTSLTPSATGGTWSSSSAANATVDAAGVVTGVAAGSATISYITASDTGTLNITINPTPAAITGLASVCVGATTTLSSTTTGGFWASINSATASVDASGTVTGVSADTVTIGYGFPTGCFVTTIVTVTTCPTATTIIEKETRYSVVPNPSKGTFMVQLPENTTATITVSDMLGRALKQFRMHNTSSTPCDVNNLSPGTYILNIASEKETFRTKIIITK